MAHLWEIDHPYYGADGSLEKVDSFDELKASLDHSDEDMNVIYRWDCGSHPRPQENDMTTTTPDRPANDDPSEIARSGRPAPDRRGAAAVRDRAVHVDDPARGGGMTIDIIAALRSATDHLEKYKQQLVENATAVTVATSFRVQVYPVRGRTHLSVFADWVPTLTDPQPIIVTAPGHFELRGLLADGTPVEVVCLPDDDELDLLAANTRIDKGDRFPVELLLRLTSPVAAETRPAAEAVAR